MHVRTHAHTHTHIYARTHMHAQKCTRTHEHTQGLTSYKLYNDLNDDHQKTYNIIQLLAVILFTCVHTIPHYFIHMIPKDALQSLTRKSHSNNIWLNIYTHNSEGIPAAC